MRRPETPRRIEFLDEQPVSQVGIVVRDLDSALGVYDRLWGGGPWRIYTYGPGLLRHSTYRGEPGRYTVRIALAALRPQIELLEALEGPSIYDEWLETRGEGLHHLGFWVDSLDEAIEQMARAGYAVIQSGAGFGLDGDGGYAYFDTEPDFGVILEAIEPPERRRDPELTWG